MEILQVDDDDSFAVTVAVALEEVAKQRAQRVRGRVGWKQLASVLAFCARRRAQKVSSTSSMTSKSTASRSQQASKSPGCSMVVMKLPAARKSRNARASPSRSRLRHGGVPNRSTMSTHSARCSPVGRFPVDGSWAAITTQLHRCVYLKSSSNSQHGDHSALHGRTTTHVLQMTVVSRAAPREQSPTASSVGLPTRTCHSPAAGQYPQPTRSGRWTFPKAALQNAESSRSAACRRASESTRGVPRGQATPTCTSSSTPAVGELGVVPMP